MCTRDQETEAGEDSDGQNCVFLDLNRHFSKEDIQGVKSVLGNSSNWAEKAVKPMEPMSIFIVFFYS